MRHADRRSMALGAAGIYAVAVLVTLVEVLVPGGAAFSVVPAAIGAALIPVIYHVGPRVPPWALFLLGPLGTVLVAAGVASNLGATDSAMLYTWPVLWVSAFYGRRGAVLILLWTGVAHGVALWSMPPGLGSPDRWIDVMSSSAVLAVVVRVLWERNERLVERLTAEARVDPLTELANRRGLDERMDVEVPRANRDGGRMAIVVFDIDHFKRVNDRHGHEAGDRVLAWLGTVLREQVRGVDIAARLGGEEFAVVLPGGDEQAALRLAERVREVVAGGREGLSLTVSAGVAAAGAPLDPVALLAEADAALYAAKRGGRDRVVRASVPARLAAA